MIGGTNANLIPASILKEDFYDNLHGAHRALREAFTLRAKDGLSQDDLASRLGVDKSLVSKRLRGLENLTLRTLSFMASALGCRLLILFQPYENVQSPAGNYQYGCLDKSTDTRAINQMSALSSVSATVP